MIQVQIQYQESPNPSNIIERQIPLATFPGQAGKQGSRAQIWLYLLMVYEAITRVLSSDLSVVSIHCPLHCVLEEAKSTSITFAG